MSFVLVCLILGLALAIERIIYLTLSTTNNDKLLAEVEIALNSGGVDAAKDVCRNARGPVASIFYQGLDKAGDTVAAHDAGAISEQAAAGEVALTFQCSPGKKQAIGLAAGGDENAHFDDIDCAL